jgi:DNA-binding NarL/FixJ family response regulator
VHVVEIQIAHRWVGKAASPYHRAVLVGRSAEMATIGRVLAAAREGRSGLLVVHGEAGVGKSALLEQAVENADEFTVLRGVGIESESELAFAALHQILRPVLDRMERLPAPQAAALQAAFALSDDIVGERFRVSLGVLGILAEVAEERPVLCVVDDAQWLDQSSADALLFAARRFDAERIALLVAVRDDTESAFSAPGLPVLRAGPLEPHDARALVVERLGPHVSFPALDWVLTNAKGNPLALVELPATLTARQLAGHEPLETELPRPTSVEQSYLQRVARLQPDVRSVLVVTACEELGDRATVVRAAAELGLAVEGLEVAETEGVLSVRRDRIEFCHPLMRSAVYRGAGFAERERAHRALAAVLQDPVDADRRAWHHSAATVGTDDEIAAELEGTADRARLRGGHGAASVSLERAAELTAEPEARGRRLVMGARAAWHAGQPDRALALLDRAGPIVTEPVLRGELDYVRGLIQFRCGSLHDAGEILVGAAAEIASVDPHKAHEMLLDAGSVAAKSGNVTRLAEIARTVANLPRDEDELQGLRIDLLSGLGGLIEGRTAQEVPLIHNAIARAGEFDDPHLLSWAAMGAAAVGDETSEAALLRRAVAVARNSGAVDTLVFVLETAVNSAMLAGRYNVEAEATEGLTLADEAGLSNAATSHRAALAWIAGLQGRDDDCRAHAAEVADSAQANGLANAYSAAEWGLALLDLGGGRTSEAMTRLVALHKAPRSVAHPLLVLTSTPDLVEACVRAGENERGAASFATLQEFAGPEAPAWIRALAARCRGLLSEGAGAEAWFQEALSLHAEGRRPFDRARTELVYGEFLRRQRRRTDAREQLRSAIPGFEHFRAEPWAERARAELRATGETARKRDPSTMDELTPQELQIAQLVAEGNSNKDVASQLFLSPRTVEYHLRKVFAKLGISSRAELIREGVAAGRSGALVG